MWGDDPRPGSRNLGKFTARRNSNETRPNLGVCARIWGDLARGAAGVENLCLGDSCDFTFCRALMCIERALLKSVTEMSSL